MLLGQKRADDAAGGMVAARWRLATVGRPCVRNNHKPLAMTTELPMLDGRNGQGATGFRAPISDVALAWGVDWRTQFVSHTPPPGGFLRGGESKAFKAVDGVRAILGACGVSVRRPSCCGGQGS